MNQQTTPHSSTATSPCLCQCKTALSDAVTRFLASGVGVDYQITTQIIKKNADGTWQKACPDSQGMQKQGSLHMASLDIALGMLLACLVSGVCMGMCGIKRMFH